jgi:hypothetical protein
MTYKISKDITILHIEDAWKFSFSFDEYGNVTVCSNEDIETMHGEYSRKSTEISIPKDCIQHFINALRSFQ